MRLVIGNSAEKDLAEIEAKAVVKSATHIKKHKMMLEGLKGKCFYAMMRDV